MTIPRFPIEIKEDSTFPCEAVYRVYETDGLMQYNRAILGNASVPVAAVGRRSLLTVLASIPIQSENDMATQTTHSPTAVAKVPPYLSINPGLFESQDHWSYRDLQKLAKRLDLCSTGTREDIVQRLKAWHREERSTGQAGQFQSVQVRATPDGKAISPRLLSPLVTSKNRPQQGILSSSRPNSARKDSARKGESSDCGTPKPLTERGNVLFSPYNMVKLIPSKEHSEMFGQYREPSYSDAYDDSP